MSSQNSEAIQALRWFCDRVERGEVRSKESYAKFKDILERTHARPQGDARAAFEVDFLRRNPRQENYLARQDNGDYWRDCTRQEYEDWMNGWTAALTRSAPSVDVEKLVDMVDDILSPVFNTALYAADMRKEARKAANVLVDALRAAPTASASGRGVDATAGFSPSTYRSRGGNYTIEARGDGRWAICSYGMVYSKQKDDFVYEPLPSSRTTAFMDDTRFDSVEDAAATYRTALEGTNDHGK